MPDYSAIDAKAARATLERLVDAAYTTNLLYYDGDHWQGADGWIGSHLQTADAAELARATALIERAFVSANKVREVVRRHVSAVVGREPAWRLTVARPLRDGEEPTTQEQALISEAEAALTEWWNRVLSGVPTPDAEGTVLEQAAIGALLGRQSLLRLYVPGEVVTGQRPAPAVNPIAAQLARIELEAVPPDRGVLARDPATGQPVGVVSVPPAASLFAEDAGADEGPVELHYLDDAGATVLQILDGEASAAGGPFVLGGRLLVAPVTAPPLVTPQIIALQRSINHALTVLEHNTDLAGSPERWIWNAMRPDVEWDSDAGEWKRTTTTPRVGAGVTNYATGLPIYGDPEHPDVVTGYTSPSGERFEPVDPTSLIQTQAALYTAILQEAGQIHALISGDATASGESRKQARAEFTESLRPTARAIEAALRSVLEAALGLAAAFAGQPGRFAALRADVTCSIDAGPLTGDEQREIREQHGAGLISTETAMGRLGVDDVDAEQGRIAAERQPPAVTPPPAPTGTETSEATNGQRDAPMPMEVVTE